MQGPEYPRCLAVSQSAPFIVVLAALAQKCAHVHATSAFPSVERTAAADTPALHDVKCCQLYGKSLLLLSSTMF